jgi:hypothetical protein
MLSTQDILLPPTGYKNNNFFLSICAQAPALAVEIDSLFKISGVPNSLGTPDKNSQNPKMNKRDRNIALKRI